MPKRCIGIDIGRGHVCAAQVARTAEGLRLEKAFAMQTRRSTDSLPAILHSLTDEHGFDRRADVALALPQQIFFFADIETDAGGLERIRALDTAGLKDYFPIPADDIIAQVCSVLRLEGGKSSVLVAASSRGQLGEGLRLFSEGKIKPTCLDTPITAAHATILTNHPESAGGLATLLYVDSATLSLAVTHDGNILLVRNIPMFSSGEQDAETFAQQTADIVAQEIEITWRRLFGSRSGPGSSPLHDRPPPEDGCADARPSGQDRQPGHPGQSVRPGGPVRRCRCGPAVMRRRGTGPESAPAGQCQAHRLPGGVSGANATETAPQEGTDGVCRLGGRGGDRLGGGPAPAIVVSGIELWTIEKAGGGSLSPSRAGRGEHRRPRRPASAETGRLPQRGGPDQPEPRPAIPAGDSVCPEPKHPCRNRSETPGGADRAGLRTDHGNL